MGGPKLAGKLNGDTFEGISHLVSGILLPISDNDPDDFAMLYANLVLPSGGTEPPREVRTPLRFRESWLARSRARPVILGAKLDEKAKPTERQVALFFFRGHLYTVGTPAGTAEEHEHAALLVEREALRAERRRNRLDDEVEALRSSVGTAAERSYITVAVRDAAWLRDDGRCVECGATDNLGLSHIIPVDQGGGSDLGNVHILCSSCRQRETAFFD